MPFKLGHYPSKAILEAIREKADYALKQLHEAAEERSMRWKCKDCRYIAATAQLAEIKRDAGFFLLCFAALCHAESTNGLRYALQQVKQPTPAQCGSKGAVRRVAEAGITCPIRSDSVKVEHFLTQTQRNCESSPPGGIFYGSRFLSKPIVA